MELKKKKKIHLTVELVYLNFHSAKGCYSAVKPSESEPHSCPRPHSEAAECRQASAPQTITR